MQHNRILFGVMWYNHPSSGVETGRSGGKMNRRFLITILLYCMALLAAGVVGAAEGPPGAPGRPGRVRLEQPFPRTADPAAFVPFEVDGRTHVTLDVLDAAGNPVVRLAEGVYAGGRHAVRWRGCDGDGRRVAPGVYTVRMNAGGRIRTRVLPVIG